MDFFYYFKSRQGEMIRLLKEIVGRESPSGEKKAVDSCSSYVADELKKAGARITRFPQKKLGAFYLAEITSRVHLYEREDALPCDVVFPLPVRAVVIRQSV